MRSRTLFATLGSLTLPLLLAGCPGDDTPSPAPPAAPPAAPAPAPGAAAPGIDAAALPPGVTAQMVQQGQQIFTGPGICFTCHGPDGAGTALAPSLRDGDWLWIDPAGDVYEQIQTVIRTGVAQPRQAPAPMPPMGGANLSDEQLRAVSAYVFTMFGQ